MNGIKDSSSVSEPKKSEVKVILQQNSQIIIKSLILHHNFIFDIINQLLSFSFSQHRLQHRLGKLLQNHALVYASTIKFWEFHIHLQTKKEYFTSLELLFGHRTNKDM